MRWLVTTLVASALLLAPLGARAADLVVWWNKGFYPQEDAAVREIIAAFEQKTGKQVELVQPAQSETPQKAQAALEAGGPPDFLYGNAIDLAVARWAYEDRLVDLEGVLREPLVRQRWQALDIWAPIAYPA